MLSFSFRRPRMDTRPIMSMFILFISFSSWHRLCLMIFHTSLTALTEARHQLFNFIEFDILLLRSLVESATLLWLVNDTAFSEHFCDQQTFPQSDNIPQMLFRSADAANCGPSITAIGKCCCDQRTVLWSMTVWDFMWLYVPILLKSVNIYGNDFQ